MFELKIRYWSFLFVKIRPEKDTFKNLLVFSAEQKSLIFLGRICFFCNFKIFEETLFKLMKSTLHCRVEWLHHNFSYLLVNNVILK